MWASAKLKLVDPRLTPLSSAGKIAVVSVDPKVIWFDETETSVKLFNDKLILEEPSKDTPLIFTADANLLDVVAFPSNVFTTSVDDE